MSWTLNWICKKCGRRQQAEHSPGDPMPECPSCLADEAETGKLDT